MGYIDKKLKAEQNNLTSYLTTILFVYRSISCSAHRMKYRIWVRTRFEGDKTRHPCCVIYKEGKLIALVTRYHFWHLPIGIHFSLPFSINRQSYQCPSKSKAQENASKTKNQRTTQLWTFSCEIYSVATRHPFPSSIIYSFKLKPFNTETLTNAMIHWTMNIIKIKTNAINAQTVARHGYRPKTDLLVSNEHVSMYSHG